MTTPARATLQVSAYTRRAPVDPYAEIRKAKHEQLRRELLVARMEREIAEMVREELERDE